MTKPDRKKKSHKEKVDISSEKEYMPVSGFKSKLTSIMVTLKILGARTIKKIFSC